MPRTTHPGNIKIYLAQIFDEDNELTSQWLAIFDAFTRAREDGDIATQGILREMTEAQARKLLDRIGLAV